MKITNLKLVEESEEFVIFEVCFKSFFGGTKTRLGCFERRWKRFYWMDNNNLIYSSDGIEAWISTGVKEMKIY